MLKMNTWYLFGNLSKEDKLKFVEALLGGEYVSVCAIDPSEITDASSHKLVGVVFQDMFYYMITKKTPTINWDMIKKEFKYLAIDEDGDVYLYEEEPLAEIPIGSWEAPSRSSCERLIEQPELMSDEFFTKGEVAWYDSLIVRPEEVEEDSTENTYVNLYQDGQ